MTPDQVKLMEMILKQQEAMVETHWIMINTICPLPMMDDDEQVRMMMQ